MGPEFDRAIHQVREYVEHVLYNMLDNKRKKPEAEDHFQPAINVLIDMHSYLTDELARGGKG